MILRREEPSDVPSIARVHAHAFGALAVHEGTPIEVGLVDDLRADPGWVPALSIVAEDPSGDVVGHVVATEGRVGEVPAVGIGPLGVLPSCHGQGIGAALMHAVVAAADALGYPVAALLGDPRYYSRFGFVAARSVGIAAPDETWAEHFQARTLASHTGEEGTFRYAAPFEAL